VSRKKRKTGERVFVSITPEGNLQIMIGKDSRRARADEKLRAELAAMLDTNEVDSAGRVRLPAQLSFPFSPSRKPKSGS